jgi:hypothetical protein
LGTLGSPRQEEPAVLVGRHRRDKGAAVFSCRQDRITLPLSD